MTMTLEELRADLATWQPRRTHDLSTIDAAIRERDELRTAVRFGKLCADAGVDYKVRAEKAEAELAALRKRVDNAPTGTLLVNYSHGQPISANVAADDGEALAAIDQCSVRLVADDA